MAGFILAIAMDIATLDLKIQVIPSCASASCRSMIGDLIAQRSGNTQSTGSLSFCSSVLARLRRQSGSVRDHAWAGSLHIVGSDSNNC